SATPSRAPHRLHLAPNSCSPQGDDIKGFPTIDGPPEEAVGPDTTAAPLGLLSGALDRPRRAVTPSRSHDLLRCSEQSYVRRNPMFHSALPTDVRIAYVGLPPALWQLSLAGAATGFVGALLGLGGGVFLVPLLTLGFGIPIRAAIAASLVSVIATASASSTINL